MEKKEDKRRKETLKKERDRARDGPEGDDENERMKEREIPASEKRESMKGMNK